MAENFAAPVPRDRVAIGKAAGFAADDLVAPVANVFSLQHSHFLSRVKYLVVEEIWTQLSKYLLPGDLEHDRFAIEIALCTKQSCINEHCVVGREDAIRPWVLPKMWSLGRIRVTASNSSRSPEGPIRIRGGVEDPEARPMSN
jgi:hypothetical protein